MGQALVLWHFAGPSYFTADDYVHFQEVFQAGGLSLHYLREPAISHFAPGHRAAYYFLQTWAPGNYDAALAFLIAVHFVSVVLLQRILALVFGRRWWIFALVAAFAISPIFMPGLQIFAAGIHYEPATLFSLATVHAHLCWRATGRRGWFVWSVVAFCLGLAFYEKVVLVPVYLAALDLLVLDPRRPLRRGLRALARQWREWAVFAAVIVLYLIAYAIGDYPGTRGGVTPGDVVTFIYNAWFEGFVPSAFGIPVPAGTVSAGHLLAVVGANVILAGLVVLSIVRRPSAWRAWAFFAAVTLLGFVVVVNRVAEWGPQVIGHEIRYYTELAWLLPLALAFAFAPPPELDADPGPPPRPEIAPGVPGRALAAAGASVAGLAVFVAFVFWDDHEITKNWQGREARPYVERLRDSIDEAQRPDGSVGLQDGYVPDYVVNHFLALGVKRETDRPDRLRNVVHSFDPDVRFDRPAAHTYAVTPNGGLRAVRYQTLDAVQVPGPKLRLHDARWTPGRSGGRCATGRSYFSWLEYRPGRPFRGRHVTLRLRYRTDPAFGFPVHYDSGLGLAFPSLELPPQRRPRDLYLDVGPLPGGTSRFAALKVDLLPGRTLCLSRFTVGYFAPAR